VLCGIYEQTGGLDGRVPIEVDPLVADDTSKIIAEARAKRGWRTPARRSAASSPSSIRALAASAGRRSESLAAAPPLNHRYLVERHRGTTMTER
jgi:hypothetical protein